MSQFENIRDKYIKDVMNVESKPANILDQLPSYNSYDTNVFIDTMNIEYQEQLTLNSLLKSENVGEKSSEIKDFVRDNSERVNNELRSLEEITKDLKKICNENKELEKGIKEFEELMESEECVEIAEKMRKIKALKNDILHFLDGAGLRVQHL